MPLKTKRWNDPVEKDDGLRVLVTRYRPRGLRKSRETWAEWWKQLAPSERLLADFQGKDGPPIPWSEYRPRFLEEMRLQETRIADLAARVRGGETVTLLCSAACDDPHFCHRTLLKELVEEKLGVRQPDEKAPEPAVPTRFSKLKGWLG